MKNVYLSFVIMLQCGIAHSNDIIISNNNAASPPAPDITKNDCTVELGFKKVVVEQLLHAYLVSTDGNGRKTEIRSGPQNVDGSSTAISGNPFNCKNEDHKFGAIVPYIGKHGLLGKDSNGKDVFSPDGNATPVAWVPIKKSKQPTMCALSACLMNTVSTFTKMCKNYVMLGIDWTRNSNTTVSSALSACGVENPKPDAVNAPGWGQTWEGKGN